MKLQQKIENELSLEFNYIRPKLLTALIWFAIGEKNRKKTSEEMLMNLGKNPSEFPNKEEQENYIYNVYIRMATETCQDKKTVKNMDRIVTKIESRRAEKLLTTQECWNKVYPEKNNQNSFFSRSSNEASEPEKISNKKAKKHVSFEDDTKKRMNDHSSIKKAACKKSKHIHP
jgi:hypothetical protein